MVWLVIALVLAVAIGPILMLLPSASTRRAAKLRDAARQAGLVVEIATVPNLEADAAERVSAGGVPREPRIDCVAYRLPLPKRLAHSPRWMLVKARVESRYIDGWATPKPPVDVPTESEAYWRDVRRIIDGLPGGCVAVEAGPQMVAWYGRERIGEAEPTDVARAIRAGLRRVGEIHRGLGAATEEQ